MANNLIKNKTHVFYTVQASENTVVSHSDFMSGKVRHVSVSREIDDANKYTDKETAVKVAKFAEGKLIKHTRTEIITEVTEQIKLVEEN